jgi:hypothetical protein
LFVSVSIAIISILITSILSVSIANLLFVSVLIANALRVSVLIESGFLDVAWPRGIFQINCNIFLREFVNARIYQYRFYC